MDERGKKFSKFQKKQDEEFLNCVKAKKVYCYYAKYIDDSHIEDGFIDTTPVVKYIGVFTTNGDILYLCRRGLFVFSQSSSPNHGIYKNSLILNKKILYVGIKLKDKECFLYAPYNLDNLFKTKARRIFLMDYRL